MDKEYCDKPILGLGGTFTYCRFKPGHDGDCSNPMIGNKFHPNPCPHCGKDPGAPVPQDELDTREFTKWAREDFEKCKDSDFPLANPIHQMAAWNAALAYARREK